MEVTSGTVQTNKNYPQGHAQCMHSHDKEQVYNVWWNGFGTKTNDLTGTFLNFEACLNDNKLTCYNEVCPNYIWNCFLDAYMQINNTRN